MSTMSKTCIVCLDDLGEAAAQEPLSGTGDNNNLESSDEARNTTATKKAATSAGIPEDKLIAHLLPCSHNLHNECLKPWVERANSCPICRQSFNMVELCHFLDGKSSIAN